MKIIIPDDHKPSIELDMDKRRPMYSFFKELADYITFFRINTAGSDDMSHPAILDLEIVSTEKITKDELIKYVQFLPKETVGYIEGLDTICFKINNIDKDYFISFIPRLICLHEIYEIKGKIYVTFKGLAFTVPKDR